MDISQKSGTDYLSLLQIANKNTRQLQVENPRPVSEVTLPAAVYHGSKEHQPDVTYSKELSLTYGGIAESSENFMVRKNEAMQLLLRGTIETSLILEASYKKASENIDKVTLDKNWAFSLQADGSLQLTDPFNVLTQDEKNLINKEIINSRPLALAASDLANTFIRGLELERGPNKISRNIARFDLTRENFAQIIDLKSYIKRLDKPEGATESTHRKENPLGYLFKSLGHLTEQLKANAEPKWSVEAFRERHKDYYKS